MPVTYTKTLYLLLDPASGACSFIFDTDSAEKIAKRESRLLIEHTITFVLPDPTPTRVIQSTAKIDLTGPQPEVPTPAASDGWDYDPPDNYVLTEGDEVLLVQRTGEEFWEPVVGLRDYTVRRARDVGYKCRRKIKPQPGNDPTTIQYSPGG